MAIPDSRLEGGPVTDAHQAVAIVICQNSLHSKSDLRKRRQLFSEARPIQSARQYRAFPIKFQYSTLLTPEGLVLFVLKYQRGVMYANGDTWRQRKAGLLNLNKYLAQESIGNPTREAETALQVMVNFLNKHFPDMEEVPLAVLIAFTTVPNDQLDVQKSRIPAMHVSKVKGYLKQQWSKSKPMPKGQYEAIQAVFDKASGLVE